MNANHMLELLSSGFFWSGLFAGVLGNLAVLVLGRMLKRRHRSVAYNEDPKVPESLKKDAELQKEVDEATARHYPALMQG